jgi:adenosylcobinamide kinase/adenosylcobinamide-phosphate guanylyltransferase
VIGHLLVTGGARSGKSAHALACARALPAPRTFVATAEPGDAEMAARIAAHRRERGADFATVEEPLAVATALRRLPVGCGVAVVDCLTLWIANLLAVRDDAGVRREIDVLGDVLAAAAFPVVLVSNEVGAGVVPADATARRFRDLLGTANQRLAAAVDRVVLMVAGQPLVVKPAPRA